MPEDSSLNKPKSWGKRRRRRRSPRGPEEETADLMTELDLEMANFLVNFHTYFKGEQSDHHDLAPATFPTDENSLIKSTSSSSSGYLKIGLPFQHSDKKLEEKEKCNENRVLSKEAMGGGEMDVIGDGHEGEEDDAPASFPNSAILTLTGSKRSAPSTVGDEHDGQHAGTDESSGKKLRPSKNKAVILEESLKDPNILNLKQETKIGSYKCSHCEMTFKSHQALGGHMTLHRNKLANSAMDEVISHAPADAPIAAPAQQQHVCKKCGKSFSTGTALGGHMRAHYEGKLGGVKKAATAAGQVPIPAAEILVASPADNAAVERTRATTSTTAEPTE